jgi:hypothetical protein
VPGRRAGIIGAVAVVTALLACAPGASAAATELTVWSGSISASERPALGVFVSASGKGELLSAKNGKVSKVGTFSPSAGELAKIRSAAIAAGKGPVVSVNPKLKGGAVTTLTVSHGGTQDVAVGINQDSPGFAKLVAALNAALPKSHQLAGASPPATYRAHAAFQPATAPCPPGQQATEIQKDVPLQKAASAGLVKLKPKGGISGDSVAVDGKWKPIKAPVKVTVHVELIPPDDGQDWATTFKNDMALKFGPRTIAGGPNAGQTIEFNFDVRTRPFYGSSPTPCYHQVRISPTPGLRSYTDNSEAVSSGEWSTDDPGTDPGGWSHEVGHILGFPDHYTDNFVLPGGKSIPLPQNGLEGDALKAALKGINPSTGAVKSVPWKGLYNDIMARTGGQFTDAELNYLATHAGLHIHSDPGDILVNKSGGDQNLGVGNVFDMTVPYKGTSHLDGMFGWCIDLHKHVPDPDSAFDVLGPASAQGNAAMDALAKVLAVVAKRVTPENFGYVRGSSDAIWRVTDDSPTSDPDAISILNEAGVSNDATYNAPHFTDPNAASPDTGAITQNGVLPPPPPEETLPDPPPPQLVGVTAPKKVTASKGKAVLTVDVLLANEPDTVGLTVARGAKTVASIPAIASVEGENVHALLLKRAKPGRYTVTATGSASGTVAATFTVKRSKRRR